MRRRPAPTNQEIEDAIDAAMKGRGMPLARLVKSFSLDDLARGFAATSNYVSSPNDFFAVQMALVHAAGRKEGRQAFNRRDADVRREHRRLYRELVHEMEKTPEECGEAERAAIIAKLERADHLWAQMKAQAIERAMGI